MHWYHYRNTAGLLPKEAFEVRIHFDWIVWWSVVMHYLLWQRQFSMMCLLFSDMLAYGCTRLEIGVQSVYEDVARDTNRCAGNCVSRVATLLNSYERPTVDKAQPKCLIFVSQGSHCSRCHGIISNGKRRRFQGRHSHDAWPSERWPGTRHWPVYCKNNTLKYKH